MFNGKVFPQSMSYADIRPEVVENDIRLVRFIPTTAQSGMKPGDLVKFQIIGGGFLDPYSTYLSFTVTCTDMATTPGPEVRFLDRSAHSFINRWVLRSNQVELERTEDYDVQAAMINDMIYSPEQNCLHHWEGFPTHQAELGGYRNSIGGQSNVSGLYNNASPAVDAVSTGFVGAANNGFQERASLVQLLNQGASPITHKYIGECAFHNQAPILTTQTLGTANGIATGATIVPNVIGAASASTIVLDSRYVVDRQKRADLKLLDTQPNVIDQSSLPIDFAYHVDGQRVSTNKPTLGSYSITPVGTTTQHFLIPLYSGVLGVLLPDKKLIPISLIPLELDIYLNRHALYSSLGTAAASRDYTISKINLYANVFYFETAVHKSVEAQTADKGMFIYCNSFYQCSPVGLPLQQIPMTIPITCNLKGINSVHTVFYYDNYSRNAWSRKLHFVSHNLQKYQLLNGTQLMPQEAIVGDSGNSQTSSQLPFLVEMYKAWGIMHNPTQDGAIQPFNYCGDQYGNQMDPMSILFGNGADVDRSLAQIMNRQGNVGRCQFGVSMEGEELGQETTMLTGKRSQIPFMLNLAGTKTEIGSSIMNTYCRCDYVVYVRPDYQVVCLGK